MGYVLLNTDHYGKNMVEDEPKLIKEIESENLIEAFKQIVEFEEGFDVESFINNFNEIGCSKSSKIFEEKAVSINKENLKSLDYLFIDINENGIHIYFTLEYDDGYYYTIKEK